VGFLKVILVFLLLFLFQFNAHASKLEIPQIPDSVFEVFHTKIRPKMMAAYKSYYDNFGSQLGDEFYQAYEYLSPKVAHIYENDKTFFRTHDPELYEDFARVPTPIKIAHEEFLFALWGTLNKVSSTQKISKLNERFAKPTQMVFEASAVRNGTSKVADVEQTRLERLLNDIRDYAPDKEMRSCFRIYGVPSQIINAINVGCSIFVNKALYDILDDNEVRAVLSHEMSHGSNGDGIKTFGHLIKSIFAHYSVLAAEETIWLLTDEEMEYLTAHYQSGPGEQLINRVAEQAPALEIRADMNGAKILNSAGYSAEPMISALTKLHDAAMKKKLKDKDNRKSVRNYPTLEKRVEAIRSVMKF
jgi:hypothetical protein